MKTLQRVLLGMAVGGALAAQTPAVPTPPEPPHLRRVFLMKYADPRHIADVLRVFGYSINADRDLLVGAVTAPADGMAAVEDAIKRLDVPAASPKDVDLVAYMVVASEQPSTGPGLPADLQPVATELKKIFPFKSFHLLDSILLRTQPGYRATANGIASGGTPYSFAVVPSSVTEDPKGALIRLDHLDLSLRLPGDHEASIRTEISVREGQRVVVGRSNMGADQALILVVTAKIAE